MRVRAIGHASTILLPLLAMVALPGARLYGQRIERVGDGDIEVDRRLDRLIGSGDYLLIDADTLLAPDDTVPRSVLVVNAVLIVEGTVAGDLVAVEANTFLRPTAQIRGDAVNVGGGLYRSALARVDGAVLDRPLVPYRVTRSPGVLRIEARSDTPPLALDGWRGFHPPTYDRVNALSIGWGATYRLPPVRSVQPRLHGDIGYHSERGALTGGAELAFERGRTSLVVGAAERVVTNEEWIRGDARNSLSFLVRGKDYRDYYEVDRFYAGIRQRSGGAGWDWAAEARVQRERAESLRADDPWTLFDDDFRPNLPVDEGAIASLVLEGEAEWEGRYVALEADAMLEFAGEVVGGDFSFGRYLVQGEWAMQALADHTLEIEWHFRGPLPGTGTLPRQRWSFVGGSGTLNTFEIAEFRGDRVAFVESAYIIPLPERLRLPVLGVPDLELLHAVGMAWTDDVERPLEQNIGARLQFFGIYLRLLTDPRRPVDAVDLDVGVSWPFGGDYPWERGGG